MAPLERVSIVSKFRFTNVSVRVKIKRNLQIGMRISLICSVLIEFIGNSIFHNGVYLLIFCLSSKWWFVVDDAHKGKIKCKRMQIYRQLLRYTNDSASLLTNSNTQPKDLINFICQFLMAKFYVFNLNFTITAIAHSNLVVEITKTRFHLEKETQRIYLFVTNIKFGIGTEIFACYRFEHCKWYDTLLNSLSSSHLRRMATL